jgi:hypothetical protein
MKKGLINLNNILVSYSKRHIKVILSLLIISISLLIFCAFNGKFYVHVYDEQTREYVKMDYKDITTILSSECVGTPPTGESGLYMFESKLAFPGFVIVKVKGYESKSLFGFLGFKNKIDVYLRRSS